MPGHVDPKVIASIASWVDKVAKSFTEAPSGSWRRLGRLGPGPAFSSL